MSIEVNKKFWQGTNFYIALLMVAGGLYAGIQDTDVKPIVSGIFGIVASVGLLREKLKGSTLVTFKEWIKSKNTWSYLGIAIVQVIPSIPADFFTRLNEIATAAIDQNWTAFISAILSGATMIYFWIRGSQTAKA